jgi:hypothetical protein
VPLVVAAVLGGLATLPTGSRAKDAQMDIAGQTLGTAALAALVFALIEGGKGGFASVPAAVGLAVALIAFAGFITVEQRLSSAAEGTGSRAGNAAARPLLDLSWFRRPEFCGANAGAGLMNLGTLGGCSRSGSTCSRAKGSRRSKRGSPWCHSRRRLPP